MIGVGTLMEVIWPVISRVVGGEDVASRLIGVTADGADIDRKRAHFGFEMVLDDNLDALRRNHPDIIMFSPPPPVAPGLIHSALVPYYEERRAEGGPLPELIAFPPVPTGSVYLDALGADVAVVNMIPNNVTSIAGQPVDDEGFYVCSFAAPWPADRVAALQELFAGQGSYVELEADQIVPMLGGACTVSSLWYAVPAVADLVGADHNRVGSFLRSRLSPDRGSGDEGPGGEPPRADLLAAMIRGWHDGVSRYYGETDIDPAAASILVDRGFDLTLHTTAAEPREVLTDLAVGAATKGGVLERAIRCVDEELLPAIEAGLGDGGRDRWRADFTELVTAAAHTVRRHGSTLAD